MHKVKYILANSCSQLTEAVRTGEISINLAEKWSHAPEAEQCENLRQNRIKRGIRRKVRTLVAGQAALLGKSKAEQQVIELAEFVTFLQHLNAIAFEESSELKSVEVKFVKDPGRTVFVPEDLLSGFALGPVATNA